MNQNDHLMRLTETREAFDSVAADYDGPRGNNLLIQDICDAGIVEFMPRMEGTILHAILAPSKKQEAPRPKPAAAPQASAPAAQA